MSKENRTEKLVFAALEIITTVSFMVFLLGMCWCVSKFVMWVIF